MSERKNKFDDFDRYADLKKNVIQFHAGLFTLDQNFSMFSKLMYVQWFFSHSKLIYFEICHALHLSMELAFIFLFAQEQYMWTRKKTTSNNAFNGFLCLIVDHERSRNDF